MRWSAQDWVGLTHQPDPSAIRDRQLAADLTEAMADLDAANEALDARDRILTRLDHLEHAPETSTPDAVGRWASEQGPGIVPTGARG